MAEDRIDVHIPPRPTLLDSVRLRDIQLSLPAAPDPWHRQGKPQPCTASLKLSYSSAVAAAAADDVSLSLDYGKLYRRLAEDIRQMGQQEGLGQPTVFVDGNLKDEKAVNTLGQDVRVIGGVVANCGLGLLDETAAGIRRMSHVHQSPRNSINSTALPVRSLDEEQQQQRRRSSSAAAPFPISGDYGQCEVWIHLPKALLRAEGGLRYRSVTLWGYEQPDETGTETAVAAIDADRRSVVLEEEFRIEGIRCYCILGVNSHERLEKQAVMVTLEFKGPGQLAWGTTVVDTYQEMTRTVAEVRLSLSPSSLLFLCFTDYAVARESKELLSRQWRHWLPSSHES